jgi:hypothetical protein
MENYTAQKNHTFTAELIIIRYTSLLYLYKPKIYANVTPLYVIFINLGSQIAGNYNLSVVLYFACTRGIYSFFF